MTLNDLVIRIKTRSHRGDRNITNDEITQQCIDAINDARRDTIILVPKQWLRTTGTITTVIGTSLYDLPSDCQEPVLFRFTYQGTDYLISKVDSEREFYQNIFGSTIANNYPVYYYDAGVNQATKCRQLFFFPAPDKVYTIQFPYMMDPTLVDLTVADLSTEIPVFPSYVQDVLWKGALYYFIQNFDDPSTDQKLRDYSAARLAVETSDERDLDTDLSFRFDVGNRMTDFRDPGTGIRLK